MSCWIYEWVNGLYEIYGFIIFWNYAIILTLRSQCKPKHILENGFKSFEEPFWVLFGWMLHMWVLTAVIEMWLYDFPSTTWWGDYLRPLMLGWPKGSLKFFHSIVQKNPNEICGKLNIFSLPLWKINWQQDCGFVPGVSVLLHCPPGLFWYQDLLALNTIALWCCVKSGYASCFVLGPHCCFSNSESCIVSCKF